MVLAVCRLCGLRADLRESHIIPKFAFRWLKATGGHYFRFTGDPNRRRQDGVKEYLLCDDCEQAFGVSETWFADHVFHGYCDRRETEWAYDGRLFHFGLSLVWRVLTCLESRQALPPAHADLAVRTAARWRAVLRGKEKPTELDEVHVFISDIGTANGVQPVRNWSRYFGRAVDMTIAASASSAFVYAKLPRFLFFGALTPFHADAFEGTRIAPSGGILRVPQAVNDGHVGEFLIDRARNGARMVQRGLSAVQRDLINRTAIRDSSKLVRSDLGRALVSDTDALVDVTWAGKVGRNSPCPCGSGSKFKHCHGSHPRI